MAHGMKGADFDSLTGKYSTQGPSLYMLAAVLNRPGESVVTLLDEFYSAFGPTKQAVEKYFALWESVYPNSQFQEAYKKLKDFRKTNAEDDVTRFIGLGGTERTWERASKTNAD